MNIVNIWNRIKFILRYKTLRLVVVAPDDEKKVLVFSNNFGVVACPRRCPHQGALMEGAAVENDQLICPWHGCYYDLKDRSFNSKKSF